MPKSKDMEKAIKEKGVNEETDGKVPGVHVNTFERQKYFIILFVVEFAILMGVGMNSNIVQKGFLVSTNYANVTVLNTTVSNWTETTGNVTTISYPNQTGWYYWSLVWWIFGLAILSTILKCF